MSDAVFPVYVLTKDCGDVKEFPTLAAMQHHLEAIDVENEEFEAWDTDRRRLQLAVGKPKSQWLKIIATQDQLSEEKFAELKSKSQSWPSGIPMRQRFMRWLGARFRVVKNLKANC